MPALEAKGRSFARRAQRLEDGYRSILAQAQAAAGDVRAGLYEQEAKKGLLFLDGLKQNLYHFSQELNQLPVGLEVVRESVQKTSVPVLEAVLQRAEAHMKMLRQDGMEPKHSMGMWPFDQVADAAESLVQKTVVYGLLAYAGIKLVQHVTKTKKD